MDSLPLVTLLYFNIPAENGTFNSSSEAERKTRDYYLSCLNEQRIEELGAQPLIDLIARVSHAVALMLHGNILLLLRISQTMWALVQQNRGRLSFSNRMQHLVEPVEKY